MSDVRPVDILESRSTFPNNNNNKKLEEKISEEEMLNNFPTRDEEVYKILEVSRTVAPTQVPVLIVGESGSGKELLAKAIHIASGRESGRFIVASCMNLPENFFELELFQMNQASNEYNNRRSALLGSLMLDELTELNPAMQLKLFRMLRDQDENRPALNPGSVSSGRVIACTHRDLQDQVNAGKFRNDLFFKLHVICIKIPSLRKRVVDIDYYSEIFIREFNIQFSKNVQLSPTAKQALRAYTWPGNVRELRNILQRSVLLAAHDYIGVEDLHLIRVNSRTELAMAEALPQVTLRELEQRLILQTLRRMNGNRTHSAKALGISLRALRYKLNELVECGFEVEGKNA